MMSEKGLEELAECLKALESIGLLKPGTTPPEGHVYAKDGSLVGLPWNASANIAPPTV